MDEVECWEERVTYLDKQMKEARAHLKAARIALAPFQVGDEVEASTGHGYLPALIQEVEPFGDRSYWYHASFRKKNGDWGNPRRVYSEVRKPTNDA